MEIRQMQKERNEQYAQRRELAVGRLRGIVSEETVSERYRMYFQDVSLFLLELENVRRKVESGEWDRYSTGEMHSLNEILYSDITEEQIWEKLCEPCVRGREFRRGDGAALKPSLCGNAIGHTVCF